MDTIITLAMLGGAIGFVLGALASSQRENTMTFTKKQITMSKL